MRLPPAPTRSPARSRAGLLLGVLLLGAAPGAWARPGPARGRPRAPAHATPPARTPPEDARDAAAEAHFAKGHRFHLEGLFQEAITEFLEAYRIKPHPTVLFNIAQAYERLLQYSEAVTWFERYLREGGPGAPYRVIVQNRLRVLRGLPSRIHVETTPPATASLIDPDGVVERAQTPTEFRVKAGRYTLRVTRDGYLPQERRLGAEIGQPYFYQFTLEQQRELVTIRPNPSKARVFIDRKLVTTGLYADRLPVGKHTLLVEYGRHTPYETQFNLRPGHRLEYDVVLPAPPPQGRVEFVVGMGAYGAVALPLALHSGGVLGPGDVGLILSSGAGSAGLAALGAFYATRRGIRQATSSLLIAGVTWGGMEGLALGILADRSNARLLSGLTVGASLLGLGTTLVLARPLHPSPGQAAMINSGGLWGSALGIGLGYALRGDRRDLDLTLLIGVNVGLITSGVLINHFDVSRTHMFLIDLGTAAGAALGVAIAFGTSGIDPAKSNAGTARLARGGLIGGTIGIITAAILTRNYDRRQGTIERDSLIALEAGELKVGLPLPQLAAAPARAGGSDLQVTLKLASGRF